jgi:hypothetical protein
MGRSSTAAAGRADRFGQRIAGARSGREEFAESAAYFRAVMAAVARGGDADAEWSDKQLRALAKQLVDLAIKADTRTS